MIIEDSELARFELKTLLRDYPQVELVGEADSVPAAISLVSKLKPDLILVDIDLPGGSIFDVLDQVELLPALIFTTAFEQHALESFRYNTIDYLLKPVHKNELARALGKIDFLGNVSKDSLQTDTDTNERVLIKDGEKCWMVKSDEIRLVEAIGNYCRVYFNDNAPMIYRTLSKMEEKLPKRNFVRANRSQLVNLDHIKSSTPLKSGVLNLYLHDGTEVSVSRRQTAKLKELLRL